MEKSTRIDAHCHFFNLWYLISELLAMGYDAILGGGYPRGKAAPVGFGAKPVAFDPGAKEGLKGAIDTLIRHIAQLSASMFNSFEDNYILLKKNYVAVYGGASELSAFPLMMDIYYMFDGYFGASKGAAMGASATPPTREDLDKEFEAWFSAEKAAIMEGLEGKRRNVFSTYRSLLADPELLELEASLDALRRDLAEGGNAGFKGLASGGITAAMTPGFEKEIRDSIALRDKYPQSIFPFLAVDPRRAGIMSLVKGKDVFTGKDRDLVSASGPFYGIKLYPRLGYTPAEVESIGLLEWCAEKQIPITFHCNTGGFPPLPDWRWQENSDPEPWGEYLTKYKDRHGGLRVDFAHNGDGRDAWRQTINSYLANEGGKYGDNVYSDIACYAKAASLQNAKDAYDKDERLRGKLMFGTDFNVMLMTGWVDLQEYFRQYNRIFADPAGRPYADEMMSAAPDRFLHATESGAEAQPDDAKAVNRKLNRDIKLGWLRDPPDVRDFTVYTARVPSRQLELNKIRPVRDMVGGLFAASAKALPKSVDLREWCSPVEDQKALGSCTANAAVGLVEYFERRATGRYIDASRLFLYKVSRKLLGWEGDSGAFLRTAMEALVLFGAPPEAYFPYDIGSFDAEPDSFAYAFAQNYKTINYFRLDPSGTRPEELLVAIKAALAGGYPSIFGFSVYDSMGEAEASEGMVPFPAKRDAYRGGHAVMAVGYDDGLEIRNSAPGSMPTRGAFLFRNSWGERWGKNGYGWLPYEYLLSGLAVDWWSIVKQEWVDTNNFS